MTTVIARPQAANTHGESRESDPLTPAPIAPSDPVIATRA